ncbi:MAG TPA: glycoside hydrolase family 88 protein [Thermoanaerobaculia bacterium]|nr:glycoside hydrolase family 88 protein [Thermoanaerobaculia bacterium]
MCLLAPEAARGATRSEVRDAALRAAGRLAAIRTLGRTWEDAPYLVGLLLVARELDRQQPGSAQPLVDEAASVVGGGDAPIANGDYAGYAQAAMDLYRIASPTDAARRAALLDATSGPFAFAWRALRVDPSSGPPADPWWTDGGYGTRFWVDDFFTLPPWLAMRGSGLDSLPADPQARDLAYEWIEAYLYDHRPAATDATSPAVPSQRARAGPLLWDPALSLFRHDAGPGWQSYWGRGNGWAAWGLARSARYLDAPYGGGRYDEVMDRIALREVLSRFAGALAARRRDDGGWPTDLLSPEACAASESSATGLITYMLAKGVNEGWLERAAYTPIVLKAFSLLLGRLDERGDLAGIQPPGTGPDCGVTASNDPSVDVSYGVGAFLLATSEILKLPDSDLAAIEAAAAQPVDRTPVGRTWIVALPHSCDRYELVLTNAGSSPVRAWADAAGAVSVEIGSASVPPGGMAILRIAPGVSSDTPLVVTLRADNDLAVQARGLRDRFVGADDEQPGRFRIPRRYAGTAVPLWAALAEDEETAFFPGRDGLLTLGGYNVSPDPANLVVKTISADGTTEALTLDLPPGGADFRTVCVAAGSRVTLSNASERAAFVPLALGRP